MNIEELRAALEWISACLRDMDQAANARGANLTDASERAAAVALTDDEQTRWDAGAAEIERLQSLIARHEQVERLTVAGQTSNEPGFHAPNVNVRAGESELYSLDGIPFGDERGVRDRALAVIERAQVGGLEDRHRAQAESLVRKMDPSVAHRVVTTSSPAYRSAFFKVVGGRSELLNSDERSALERAVALGGSAGYAVPTLLDPTIIDTGDHSENPIRRLATVKKITGTYWTGVASTGVTAEWEGEGDESADGAPTLTQPQIPTFKGNVFVPFSLESEDWASMEADLLPMITRAKDDKELAAFTTGNGTSAPQGIVTALDGTSSEIAPTTAETFAKADVDKLIAALPARFRRRGAILGNMVWFNAIRAFETTVGVGSLISTGPADYAGDLRIAGYPAYECSDMDAVLPNASATADNFGLVFADLASAYYVVDRVGLTVELIPHLFHTGNNRPSGQRGFYAWFRTGGEVVNTKAAVMLSIPTAA